MLRRVAITGMGMISPLGCGRGEFWENLRQGISAVDPVNTIVLEEKLVEERLSVQFSGEKGL